MTHWRQTARDAAKAAILAASTTAATRVYSERLTRLHTRKPDQFPAVCVYVPRDEGARKTEASPFDSTADIEVVVAATGEATDTLTAEEVASNARDVLCDEVERALLGDGGWLAACGFQTAARLSTTCELFDGEILISSATIKIGVEFEAEIAAPTTLVDFNQVNLTNDNAPADEVVDTYDEIVFPLPEGVI